MTIAPLDSRNHPHSPDAEWGVPDGRDVAARCSLWFTRTPAFGRHRVGLIGHYAAHNRVAARMVLEHACEELARQGCTLAVGPMDGSTWRHYRLITERGSEPPFFLESDNPAEWPADFTGQGFAPLARYHSALADEIHADDPRIERVASRLSRQGFAIRPLMLACFEPELSRMFRIAAASFASSFLYTPIAEQEFIAQYAPLLPYVKPELALIAERDGDPAGMVFAIPDWAQAGRGTSVDTFIVKTLAVAPRYRGRGLGSVLLQRANQAAHRLGFRRAIHALMRDENESTRISARHAAVFRRYTLYQRPLP